MGATTDARGERTGARRTRRGDNRENLMGSTGRLGSLKSLTVLTMRLEFYRRLENAGKHGRRNYIPIPSILPCALAVVGIFSPAAMAFKWTLPGIIALPFVLVINPVFFLLCLWDIIQRRANRMVIAATVFLGISLGVSFGMIWRHF